MTPRERILAALHRQLPDRTPTDGWFHKEIQDRLKRYYQTENWDEVLLQLGIEGWTSLNPQLEFPAFEAQAIEHPGAGGNVRAIWLDARTYENAWGVRHRVGVGGWYEEWVDGPLTAASSVADIDNCPLPDITQIREPDDYADQVAQLQADGLFVSGGIPNPYKQAWLLRGMDNLLCDYLLHRDMLEALYDRLYDLYGEMARCMARAGVDMLTVVGDIAMQDRIIMGPDTWRAVDKPRLARLLDDCRALNPDMLFFIHSDGDITALLDDIVEIGFNVVNPLQPECMDLTAVKRRWGDRIAMHGGVSLQRTLPFGTVEEVQQEVENLIKTCGYNGGLVVFPSNVIQPDTPLENIIACFHTARDFDLTSLRGRPG